MNNIIRTVSRRISQAPKVTWSLVAQQQQRTIASTTLVLQEKQTLKVPAMGDSITEGTIVEWTAAIGQGVKEGDVIAMIETDKVTIDIKAEIDGVITQQFCAIEDTVEVGSNLYEIDTEVAPSVVASQDSSSQKTTITEEEKNYVSAPTTTDEIVDNASSASDDNNTRTPSIHFLGKVGWENRLIGTTTTTTENNSFQSNPDKPNEVISLDGSMLDSMYGRPPFTEEEFDALMLGGANLAPEVISPSRGAVFASSK